MKQTLRGFIQSSQKSMIMSDKRANPPAAGNGAINASVPSRTLLARRA